MSIQQKLAACGLGATALFGLGAAGNAYLGQTKEARRPAVGRAVQQAPPTGGRTAYRSVAPRGTSAKFRPAYASVNINTATEEELDALPGIGPATAKKIVDYRLQNGGFNSIDELDRVKGIGPKKLEDIRPYCRL